MAAQKGSRSIGYIRVSTDEQCREGLSLDAQRHKIQAYCDLNDLELVGIEEDGGLSGKSLERPGLQQALSRIRCGDASVLVVFRLDRLSRSTRDTLALTEMMEANRWELHSISERLDTSSAAGRFVLTILAALGQMERETTVERTKVALAHKKTLGEWTGRIPYGFQIGSDGKLVENPQEQVVIQKVKRMKRQGKTIRDIARSLKLSIGLVHKVVNGNQKTRKTKYMKALC